MKDEAETTTTTRRPYRSAAREAQKAQTRDRIVATIAAEMAHGGLDALSMEEIAARAAVSPATLYRHFPNREALYDGLVAHFNAWVGSSRYPETPGDIIATVEHSFAAFDRDPNLVRAFLVTDLGRSARARGRRRRIAAITAALSGATVGLDERQQRQVAAIIAHLAGIQTWATLTEEFDLDGAAVGEAASWAIQVLLRAVAQQSAPAGPDLPAAVEPRGDTS